jgi:phosphoribosylanthranilate isomerase
MSSKPMSSNSMLEVKICGINEPRAMDAALEAGADLVGLVFFTASPRAALACQRGRPAARPRSARSWSRSVDADDTLLSRIVTEVSPDICSLHGAETPARRRDRSASRVR